MRGGLGTRRIMRVAEGAEVTANALFDRTKPGFGAFGLEGGGKGGRGAIMVKRNGDSEFRTFTEAFGTASPSKFTNIRLEGGDEVLIDSPGGGGYGDARERDRERVARDTYEGFVSPGAARDALRIRGLSGGRLGRAHAAGLGDGRDAVRLLRPGRREAALGRSRSRASQRRFCGEACEQLYREYVLPQQRAGG